MAGGAVRLTDPNGSIRQSFRDESLPLDFTVSEHSSLVTIEGMTHAIVRYEVRQCHGNTESRKSNGR